MDGGAPDRLGRLEILGAWLRLWTPPRGAVVPPVPWRTVAVGGVLVLVAAAVAAVALLNAESDRDAAAQRAERAAVRRHAAFLATVDREQRPRRGRGPAETRGAAGAVSAADRRGARHDLLAAAQRDIKADARERSSKPVGGVQCEPFPKRLDATPPVADLSRAAAAYDCVAVASQFETGVIGMPFRLAVHFDSGRYAWCRIVPLGDRDRLSHPLPDACRI
jgi:hypothetical protein